MFANALLNEPYCCRHDINRSIRECHSYIYIYFWCASAINILNQPMEVIMVNDARAHTNYEWTKQKKKKSRNRCVWAIVELDRSHNLIGLIHTHTHGHTFGHPYTTMDLVHIRSRTRSLNTFRYIHLVIQLDSRLAPQCRQTTTKTKQKKKNYMKKYDERKKQKLNRMRE